MDCMYVVHYIVPVFILFTIIIITLIIVIRSLKIIILHDIINIGTFPKLSINVKTQFVYLKNTIIV